MAYQESDRVKKYAEDLAKAETAKPGEWTGGTVSTQVDDALGKILNREEFKYDFNNDALYNQYAQRYQQQGKQAMRDTMGQAAALTGGYGNSYANTAGQQAYQGYLQGLNDKIPDLYSMALSQYNAQGDNLQRNYDALNTQYARQYGEWQDQQDAYQLALQNARNAYDQEYATDYAAYQNAIAQAMDVGNATGNFDRLAEFGYTADEIAAYQKAWITNNPKLAKALGYVKNTTTKKTTTNSNKLTEGEQYLINMMDSLEGSGLASTYLDGAANLAGTSWTSNYTASDVESVKKMLGK